MNNDKITLDDLCEEEYSPVHFLPESYEEILTELNRDEKPYQVTVEAWIIDDTDL